MGDKNTDDAVTLESLANDVRGLAETATESVDQARSVAAEAKAKAEETERAMRDEMDSVKSSMESIRVSLPGADEETYKGRTMSVGDFLLAGRVATVAGRDMADKLFPLCGEIDRQARKVISGETEERFWGERDQYRSMTVAVDSQGGYLVPEQTATTFIDNTYARTALSAVNATVINGVSGSPYRVSKLTTNPTAYMVGETAALTKSTPAFGRESFEPKKVGVLFGQSRESSLMTMPAAAEIAQRSAERVLALKIDQQALEGTGGQYQVTGLLNQSGLNDYNAGTDPDTQANGRDLTGYHIARMRHQVEETDTDISNFGVITHTKAKNILALEGGLAGGATSLGGPATYDPRFGRWVLTDEQLRAAYGPIGHSTQLASNITQGTNSACVNTYAGPWELFWSLFWGGLFVQTSNVAVVGSENAFTEDLVFTRLLQLFDAGSVAADRFFKSDEFSSTPTGV